MLWNFKPQLRAFRFLGHRDVVNHVEFAPSGQFIASASQDRTVRLWLPNARGESTELKGHSGAVRSVSFSSDCRNLITASDDKTVKVNTKSSID
jgi:centriolar protein POC1